MPRLPTTYPPFHIRSTLPNQSGDQQRRSRKEVEAFPTTARLIFTIVIREGTQPLRVQRLPKRTVAAFRVLRVCAVEQVGVEVVNDFDGFLGKELAVLAHNDALATLRSYARCWFRSGGTYRSGVCPLPANVRGSQHVGTPSEFRYALERGETVIGLDAEIHRGLVVLHGW